MTRRVRVAPLLVGMAGTLLLCMGLLTANADSSMMPSTTVSLTSCMWGAGLACAVLAIRIRVLDEPHLLAPAIGYGATTVLLTWAGRLLPGFSAATGPFDTATAIELALLALAAPGLLVLVQALTARAAHLWLASAAVFALAVLLSQTDLISSDPADQVVFLLGSIAVLLVSLAGATVWLLGQGRTPGDAEGWVGVGLVLTMFVAGLALVEMVSGRGLSFALTGLTIALVLLAGGLMSSFAATLQHRRRMDERLTDRIVDGLMAGFETRIVDPAHVVELEAVLASRTITTVLQPIIRLVDGKVEDVESLARFPSMTPDQAFGAAAAIGREVELELLAAEAALRRLDDLACDVGLAVNIGPEALSDPRFQALVAGCADPRRVVVELTEHKLIPRLDDVHIAFDQLRSVGARIAVDDVGAGFTGLQVLANLRPDFVKLDRSLIGGIVDDPLTQALVEGILTYATRTGAVVIAEGVEEAGTAMVLRRIGVHRGQGWHFGRPGDAVEVTLPRDAAVTKADRPHVTT
ncbi:MAG TPA: EAL domain-containing protein [Euzebya sp.]|nr:EAL domain-containing protein [Euzebya sp.]